ncbi:Uncharacterized protein Fot_06972 [Forsythia ovata]|uniref:Uncharacterized protein n=1 Tax=Forsythia ovata TaxID=205694 RepID=A0ABD1WXD8_9LAMI
MWETVGEKVNQFGYCRAENGKENKGCYTWNLRRKKGLQRLKMEEKQCWKWTKVGKNNVGFHDDCIVAAICCGVDGGDRGLVGKAVDATNDAEADNVVFVIKDLKVLGALHKVLVGLRVVEELDDEPHSVDWRIYLLDHIICVEASDMVRDLGVARKWHPPLHGSGGILLDLFIKCSSGCGGRWGGGVDPLK